MCKEHWTAHLVWIGPTLASGSIPVKSPPDKVDIATRYGLEGPGIVTRWGRDFPLPSRCTLGPTQPSVQWLPGLFPGDKRPGPGVDHPPTHMAMNLRKFRAKPLLPLFAFMACQGMNCELQVTTAAFRAKSTISCGADCCSC